MKATGIVRRIDDLGRIVIPKELRGTMTIKEGDPMEFYVKNDEIVLKKYQPGCIFCDNIEHLWQHKGRSICQGCVDTLAGCASLKTGAEARKEGTGK